MDLRGVEIVEIAEDERFERYSELLWRERQRKGMTRQGVRNWLRSSTVYASMMVQQGEVDGMVGGLATAYARTLRPALQVIGRAPDARVISGVYVMLFKNRRLYFADCTVNIHPDSDTLAQIAINAAQVAETFGDEPRIAMLSYSDFGEGRGDSSVECTRKAIELIQQERPDIAVDGEMQADTAVSKDRATANFPFSAVAGRANVLIFPDLSSGNIAYKLLRELGGATALGPIIVGLERPVNALPLGSKVSDVVNMAAITVNQVLDLERKDKVASHD